MLPFKHLAFARRTSSGPPPPSPLRVVSERVSIIFCEALAIYGIITAIMMQLRIGQLPPSKAFNLSDYYAGIELFWGGILVGVTNLACGISVGVAGSATALADAGNGDIFIRILIIEIFASALGLFGLVVGMLMVNSVPTFGDPRGGVA